MNIPREIKINYFNKTIFFIILVLIFILYFLVNPLKTVNIPQIIEEGTEFPDADMQRYISHAANLSFYVGVPFTYRILTPSLCYLLPFQLHINFLILTLLCIFLTSYLFYIYLMRLNFSSLESLIGVIFFLFSIGYINIKGYLLVDPLNNFFLVLLFYALVINSSLLYFLGITIGVFNKETVLMTIPVYYSYHLIWKQPVQWVRMAWQTTKVCGLSILFYMLLRRILSSVTTITPNEYFSLTTLIGVLKYHKQWVNLNPTGFLKIINYSLLSSLGMLWLFALINFRSAPIKIKKISIFLPLLLIPAILTTDTYRALALGFPIIIPLALLELKKYKLIKYGNWLQFLMIILVLFSFQYDKLLWSYHYFVLLIIILYLIFYFTLFYIFKKTSSTRTEIK